MKISAIAVLILSFNLKSAVYEIRDYTIEEEFFEAYVYWAENYFMPYGMERIEIVDFWVSRGDEAIVEGTNPIVSPNGQPNVTWVAKYDSREDRVYTEIKLSNIDFNDAKKVCTLIIFIL